MKLKTRKNLNVVAINSQLRQLFSHFPDDRIVSKISIQDFLMSALAVFQTKIPSLLLLDQMRYEGFAHENLKKLYGLGIIPSDTQLREILDRVPTTEFAKAFDLVFRTLQHEKVLDHFKFNIGPGHIDKYLVLMDGTEFYSSNAIGCDCCLMNSGKNSEKAEDVRFHHQLLSAAIAHPDEKILIPLTPEPISNKDGNNKNDYELVAAKRLYKSIRKSHPRLPIIMVQDALYASVQNINALRLNEMDFIIVSKKEKNKSLFNALKARENSLKDITRGEKLEVVGNKVKKTKSPLGGL